MSNFKDVIGFFMKFEGGLSRDKNDSASSVTCPMMYKGHNDWHTNRGITYRTWIHYFGTEAKELFLNMEMKDVEYIFKKGYWDKVKGDSIESKAIAATLVSWAWGSGSKTAIKMIQRIVEVPVDGLIGRITIGAINDEDEKELFARCIQARREFFREITVHNPKNLKFIKGWLRRLDSFNETFKP